MKTKQVTIDVPVFEGYEFDRFDCPVKDEKVLINGKLHTVEYAYEDKHLIYKPIPAQEWIDLPSDDPQKCLEIIREQGYQWGEEIECRVRSEKQEWISVYLEQISFGGYGYIFYDIYGDKWKHCQIKAKGV